MALGVLISQGVCCALDLVAADDLRHWDGASDLDGEALSFVAGLSEASSLDISRESGCRPFAFFSQALTEQYKKDPCAGLIVPRGRLFTLVLLLAILAVVLRVVRQWAAGCKAV